MAKYAELARNASASDPAVPLALGAAIEPRRPIGEVTLLIEADTITGAGASLTIRLQGSNDLTTWADLGTGIAVTTNNTVASEVVSLLGAHRFIRAAITAKAGTTPAVTGLDVNVFCRRGRC